jgi:hypothetical protein
VELLLGPGYVELLLGPGYVELLLDPGYVELLLGPGYVELLLGPGYVELLVGPGYVELLVGPGYVELLVGPGYVELLVGPGVVFPVPVGVMPLDGLLTNPPGWVWLAVPLFTGVVGNCGPGGVTCACCGGKVLLLVVFGVLLHPTRVVPANRNTLSVRHVLDPIFPFSSTP